MLQNLTRVPPGQMHKVTTFDGETSHIAPRESRQMDLCLIDGEHFDRAEIADFEFCLRVMAPSGAGCFTMPRSRTAGYLQRIQAAQGEDHPARFMRIRCDPCRLRDCDRRLSMQQHASIQDRWSNIFREHLSCYRTSITTDSSANRYRFAPSTPAGHWMEGGGEPLRSNWAMPRSSAGRPFRQLRRVQRPRGGSTG